LHNVFQTFTPVDKSTKGMPCEKVNAEEYGNCVIHCGSSNQPLQSHHLPPNSVLKSFQTLNQTCIHILALSNQFFDHRKIGINTDFWCGNDKLPLIQKND
jgi:hypothetical protein